MSSEDLHKTLTVSYHCWEALRKHSVGGEQISVNAFRAIVFSVIAK